ncbi:MAG: hypothetical protein QMD46_01880 [Methanomicrobiales archaeon]|nr:hypothetical protein [Methanomicrobiales archaeon]MDI6875190.1 hypothetical protein [Methanomicrobiales archaeon]
MNPEYMDVLRGDQEPLEIFNDVVRSLQDLEQFPFLLEKICREAITLDVDASERFRFALWRLQIHADIHRYQDMEQAQKAKYVAQVLEKLIFGSLMLEQENFSRD